MSFADYTDRRADDEPKAQSFKAAEKCKDCDRLMQPITMVPRGRKPTRSCRNCIDRRATAIVEAVQQAVTVEIVAAPQLAGVA